MDLFPRDWAWGIGYFSLISLNSPTPQSLELTKQWKKRCDKTSQRFFQEGSMELPYLFDLVNLYFLVGFGSRVAGYFEPRLKNSGR
jgi:hypothetical protein